MIIEICFRETVKEGENKSERNRERGRKKKVYKEEKGEQEGLLSRELIIRDKCFYRE